MKRIESRIREKISCELDIKNQNSKAIPTTRGRIVDISNSGAKLFADAEITLHAPLHIKIPLNQHDTIDCDATVVWGNNNIKKYGIKFISLDQAQKTNLENFIKHRVQNKYQLPSNIKGVCVTLKSKIDYYFKRATEIEEHLKSRPDEWGQFQAEFNREVNGIFNEIMLFEQTQLLNGHEDKISKLQDLFVNRLRGIFNRGTYFEWSIRKPYGYAGDFKIIDDIYTNNPTTKSFDRLLDNYFQLSAICVAVRNRKEDFKQILHTAIHSITDKPVKVMDLACGSCRGLSELMEKHPHWEQSVLFDCLDNEERALEYARNLIGQRKNFGFFREDIMRLASSAYFKNKYAGRAYDIIYSTGLFDYFNNKICIKIIRNIKEILHQNGKLVIANVRVRYSNPTIHCMEWVTDWKLIYRTDEEFVNLFIEAGFDPAKLTFHYEQQGVMQYVVASL